MPNYLVVAREHTGRTYAQTVDGDTPAEVARRFEAGLSPDAFDRLVSFTVTTSDSILQDRVYGGRAS